MPFLKRIHCPTPEDTTTFPFSLPLIGSIQNLEITSNVLFLVGENGSGKSTLLEALALASKRISVGDSDIQSDRTLNEVRPLANHLQLGWSKRTGKGFFLRAEDFFNFIRRNQEMEDDFDGLIDRFKDDDRVRRYMESNKRAINQRYGDDLNNFSHGEGYLTFFKSRVFPGGLYLLDEPEAALSPQRQLAFILFVHDMAQQGCQFIIATHSPIILSCPDATIWQFDENGIEPAQYNELDHVSFTKNFLESPERFWRHLTEEE